MSNLMLEWRGSTFDYLACYIYPCDRFVLQFFEVG